MVAEQNVLSPSLQKVFGLVLTLFQIPAGDQFLAAGAELAQLFGDVSFLGRRCLFSSLLQLLDFLTTMPTAFDLFTTFASCHLFFLSIVLRLLKTS